MSRPTLYIFAISHYCEKARWALEYRGVDHALEHLAPGQHAERVKALGAPGSSLPLLLADQQVVQGSSAIIDWLELEYPEPSTRLNTDPDFAEEARAIEQRLDDVAGVHVRRYYYSEAMVEYPETVMPIFLRDLPASQRSSTEENWAIVRQLMMGAMDLGTEQGQASRKIVEGELDWFDALVSDGRHYLVGDGFSRVDIAAASLFAPLALPAEHPTYGILEVPPRAAADLAEWSDRATLKWVREIYSAHR